MTSYPKDSGGVDFDPSIHQANRDGSPKTTKQGRYFLKGRRKARNGKGKAQLAAKRAARANPPPAKPAPETPEVKPPEPAPSSVKPGELPPLSPAPASEADILGEFAKPTIKPGEPDPVEPAEGSDDAPTPTLSEVAPDAPAPPVPGELSDDGLALVLVTVAETSARVGIDPGEWELRPEERVDLAASVRKVLDKHGIAPDISPEAELALKVFAVGARRAPMPKTRAWLKGAWGWFSGLFVPRKTAPKNPPQQADKPRNEADQSAPTA